MNLEEKVSRGREAELLINNPIFVESFAAVREGIINSWANTPIRDKEGAHELKLMLKLLTDVELNIKHVLDTGKIAMDQLDRQNKIKEFKAKNKFA